MLGGTWGKISVILVFFVFVKKCCRRTVSFMCYDGNFIRHM